MSILAKDDPEAIFRHAVRAALHQMDADIPPYQFRVAAHITAAEDKCVETITGAARAYSQARMYSEDALFGGEAA